MNPEKIFCPNLDCPAKGQVGEGNIKNHGQQTERYYCEVCKRTFSASTGTIFYRLRTDPAIVILVLTLLAYGCPTQAIVKAYGFDERTIKRWWQRAGKHCESFHKYSVLQRTFDLLHVQADEIKAKVQGCSYWIAMAIMVDTRLWLGGFVSLHRNKVLIQNLADQLRTIALCRPLLLAVDGLASYVTAFQKAFRSPLPSFGKLGRPKLVAWDSIAIVQVVKKRKDSELFIERRVVQGTLAFVHRLIEQSQGKAGNINTAYIERINATFRQRLHWLGRRSRSLAQQPETLNTGIFIVGVLYNFCDNHRSLRQKLWLHNERHFRWVQRTPAMAASLTDHQWTVEELFTFRIPPQRWVPPTRRGRPSLHMQKLIQRWA